jgi:hypothetical protein
VPAALDPICLFAALREHHVEYVLIGGLAAVLHGSTVMTNEADIVPSPSEDNLDCLSAALTALDARIRSDRDPDGVPFAPHPALLGSVSTLNMTTRCGDLDLAFSPAGLSDYDALVEHSVAMDIDDYRVRVASLADIIRSKTKADRPRDRAVLPILHALQEEIAMKEGGP